MPLKPIARRSLPDEVFEQLFAQIIDGERLPGERLPPERALCDSLGVNRGAIREALKRLGQAGLIEARHGGGNTVLDYRRRGGLALLPRLLFRPDGVDLSVARSIMEMRAVLGPDMARLCAQRANGDEHRLLRTAMDTFVAAGDLDAASIAALELWDVIAHGSHNVAYRLAFNSLRETYEGIRALIVHAMSDELGDTDAYRRLVAAITAHDEDSALEAAQTIVTHGTRGVLALLELMEPQARP
jgi:DNA-binding FadR family transcriptional regulator